MKLSEIWLEENTKILKLIYPNLNEIKLNKFLNGIINQYKKNNKLNLRNLYLKKYIDEDIDNVLNTIKEKKLIIGGNGSFILSPEEKTAVVSIILENKIRDKDKYKEIAKKKQHEGDEFSYKLNQALSDTMKGVINATYGIQAQSGSIFYNPDTASLITTQSRNIITEMAWTIERIFNNNVVLEDISELFMYIKFILNKNINNKIYEYIDYVPNEEDLNQLTIHLISKLVNKNITNSIKQALFRLIRNLNKEEKIKLYYANNIVKLFLNNKKISYLYNQIINSDVEFHNVEENHKDFPIVLKPVLDELSEIIIQLIHVNCSVYKRIEKYTTQVREMILISDTDSIMINLGGVIENISPILHILKYNVETDYKLVNTLIYITSKILDKVGARILENCNISEKYKKYIIMKNEFLFSRLMIFQSKKNYVGRIILREGYSVDTSVIVGVNLGNSNLNFLIEEFVENIIKGYILKSPNIDPVFILNTIDQLEKNIIDDIKVNRNIISGFKKSYGFKVHENLFQVAHIRAAEVWNRIYENKKLTPGDVFYTFPTNIVSLQACEELKYNNKEIFDKIKNNIFNKDNDQMKQYGLSRIAIPYGDEDIIKIPEWLIPYINCWEVANTHIQPIYSLLNSLNIQVNKINSLKTSSTNITYL